MVAIAAVTNFFFEPIVALNKRSVANKWFSMHTDSFLLNAILFNSPHIGLLKQHIISEISSKIQKSVFAVSLFTAGHHQIFWKATWKNFHKIPPWKWFNEKKNKKPESKFLLRTIKNLQMSFPRKIYIPKERNESNKYSSKNQRYKVEI